MEQGEHGEEQQDEEGQHQDRIRTAQGVKPSGNPVGACDDDHRQKGDHQRGDGGQDIAGPMVLGFLFPRGPRTVAGDQLGDGWFQHAQRPRVGVYFGHHTLRQRELVSDMAKPCTGVDWDP